VHYGFQSISELPSRGGITAQTGLLSTSIWRAFRHYKRGVSQAGGAWNAGERFSINGNLPNFGNFLQDGQHLTAGELQQRRQILETVQEVQINTLLLGAYAWAASCSTRSARVEPTVGMGPVMSFSRRTF